MWPTTANPERNCKDHIAIAQAERPSPTSS
jgi:hypothetical protein